MSDPTTPAAKKKDVVVTRVFAAPVERVWQAFTEPEYVMRWWGPDFFTCPACAMDFRQGGQTLVCMRAPKDFGGQDYYNTWTYEKIVPLQRIEYIQRLSDQDRRKVDPVALGLRADFPENVLTVIHFMAQGSQTEITMTEYGFPDSPMFEMAEAGLNQCLGKMAAIFAAKDEG